MQRLYGWLEKNDYAGYDTFDGLSAWVRPLTFENPFLRIALQQSVRRFPLNLRPLLGIPKSRSTKGMGFLHGDTCASIPRPATGLESARPLCPGVADRESGSPIPRSLGQSLRLPVPNRIRPQGHPERSLDVADRARFSGRV